MRYHIIYNDDSNDVHCKCGAKFDNFEQAIKHSSTVSNEPRINLLELLRENYYTKGE